MILKGAPLCDRYTYLLALWRQKNDLSKTIKQLEGDDIGNRQVHTVMKMKKKKKKKIIL